MIFREYKFRQWLGKHFHYFALKDGVCSGVVSASLKAHPITQFTGLHDIWLKPIYEGDILKNGNKFGYVKYCNSHECGQYEIKTGENTCCEKGTSWYDWEKIGNIFENPELMERNNNGTK